MEEKIKETIAASPTKSTTNVMKETDLTKVLDYFRYTTGTTLDAMFGTGVLRNSITYYVRDLIAMNLLQVIYVARDRRTKRMAQHYSADPAKWQEKPENKQYSLFAMEEA